MKKLGWVFGLMACFIFVATSYSGQAGRRAGGRHFQDGYMPLPLTGFFMNGTSGTTLNITSLTTSTTPGYEVDDRVPNINWADGETSPVFQTFEVPGDYGGNGRFVAMCTASAVSYGATKLDFDVFINSEGTAADLAATNQTPVALTAGATSSPSKLVLLPVTDFDTLQGGEQVTARFWRDGVPLSTADLEMKSVAFLYDPIP